MKVNLSEYLHSEMNILFVALNAPVNSNNNGHWFTNNLSFWNLLYRAGIITKPVRKKLEGDELVFGDTSINFKNWSIGVTDLIRNVVETDSAKVEPQTKDVKRILEILENHQVKRLCLMHSKVGEAFRDYSGISFNQNRYGKIGEYGNSDIYEVPFHNAPVPNKDAYYSLLVDNQIHKPLIAKCIPTQNKPKRQIVSVTKGEKSFIIPKFGNNITEKDIEKGELRITVNFKEYFPKQSRMVNIKFMGKNYSVGYTCREGKSSILKVGRGFMEMMKITPRSRIKVNVLNNKYLFELI